jgi:hypothetical protein
MTIMATGSATVTIDRRQSLARDDFRKGRGVIADVRFLAMT